MKLGLWLALATLVVAAGASAARKPNAGEAKAIRSIVAGFIATPRSPAAKDNRVVAISVSSVDPRFASVRLVSKSAGPSELVVHRSLGTWWVQGFGSSLGCDSAPKRVLDDLKVGCSPPGAVAWISNCGPLASAPATLMLACADGNYSLTRLKWHGWGRSTATAGGRAVANDCTPNCAAGHFHSYPATVSATSLTTCGSARYYARLTITYPGTRPAGIGKHDVHTLGC